MESRPFISYAREDQAMAVRIYADLRAAGVHPWLDLAELVPGTEWRPVIRKAMRSASHVIVLISENSASKVGFIQNELRQAIELADSRPPDIPFVIPVRLDATAPKYEQLLRLHWVDLFPDYAEGLAQLLRVFAVVRLKEQTRQKMLASASRRMRALQGLVVAIRRSSYWRYSSVMLNDLLPNSDMLESALEEAGIPVRPFGSKHGNPCPAHKVVTIGPGASMTVVRHVLGVLNDDSEWFVHLPDDRSVAEQIIIGAYGYGGAPVAALTPALRSAVRHAHFTMAVLRIWTNSERTILHADYSIEEDSC